MKKLQLLLVALALISFTAFYSCGNAAQKTEETAVEEVQEAVEEVEEAVTDSTEVVAEEAEMEATEEAPAE